MVGGSPDRCDFCGAWGVVVWSWVGAIRKLCPGCHESWFSRPGATT